MKGRAAVLALLAALALAGCGGEGRLSKEEYEAKVRAVYAEVQAAFQRTNAAGGELGERLADAQAALRGAAEELEGVPPPEEVEEEHEEIVEGLRGYADDLDPVREAAERGDRAAVDAFNAAIASNESVERIAEAAEEMKVKGYDLGPIAEE
ncbi:MAG TPA: hypothetical protein VNJ46_05150 [Gaiellaceae bacterium]|nr:hypothetical protein [Gaiellaceae bacterium]